MQIVDPIQKRLRLGDDFRGDIDKRENVLLIKRSRHSAFPFHKACVSQINELPQKADHKRHRDAHFIDTVVLLTS